MTDRLTSSGLIRTEITPRREVYYLVTEDNLKDISGKSVLADLFAILASVLWGGFVSVVITMANAAVLQAGLAQPLQTYKTVFLVAALVCTALAIIFFYIKYRAIADVKRSKLPAGEGE